MYKGDPFAQKAPPGWGIECTRFCTAVDQVDQVRRNFGIEECLAALRLSKLAKTVRVAVERRIRELERHPMPPR